MSTVTCPNCKNILTFTPPNIPTECDFCFHQMPQLSGLEIGTPPSQPINSSPSPSVQPYHLTIVYLKTNETIQIHTQDNEVVLGRNQWGEEVFSKIRQISRKHCIIQKENNHYFLSDAGSTNGTYLGEKRIDCKINPKQKLNHLEIFFLGQEPLQFVIPKHTHSEPDDKTMIISFQEEKKGSSHNNEQFECVNCHNYWAAEQEFVCPKCDTFNG